MRYMRTFATGKNAAVLILAFFSTTKSAAHAQEVERTQWAPVPGATHYIGTMEEGGVTYRIFTSSTWIMTGKGTVKKVDAWGPSGPIASQIEVTTDPLISSEDPHAPVDQLPTQPSLEEPANEPLEESREVEDTAPSPEEEYAPEAQNEDGDDSLSIDEDSAEQVNIESATFTSRSRIGVSIGMGKQWLQSEVGISDFAGNANIGGTILSGLYDREGSPLWYEGEISAHNFTTETSKSDATSKSLEEEKTTQIRARGMVFYNLFQQVSTSSAAVSGWSFGGGIQYLSHPMLVINNTLSGAAAMKSKTGIALNLGTRYATLFSPRNLLSTGLDLAPLNISGDVKTLSTNIFIDWLHLITPRIFTNVGITTNRETITHDDRCPSVANCKAEGKTESSILQFRMGLALGL